MRAKYCKIELTFFKTNLSLEQKGYESPQPKWEKSENIILNVIFLYVVVIGSLII